MATEDSNYTAFSKFFSQHHSDLSLLRFRELSIRNLLFYQAELAYLQRDLKEIERHDAAKHADPEERVNYRWKPTGYTRLPEKVTQVQVISTNLSATSDPNHGGSYEDLYIEKMMQIRSTLAKYSASYVPELTHNGSSHFSR